VPTLSLAPAPALPEAARRKPPRRAGAPHRRRAANPDDVLALRERRSAPKATNTGSSGAAEQPLNDGPIYVGAGPTAASRASASASDPSDRLTAVVSAGSTLTATLAGPLELHGGTSTVVARLAKVSGLLVGARLIGSASLSSGRVTIRFRSLILRDGRQLRVDGEAQDESGAFGLAADAPTSPEDDDQGSALGDTAKDTATDLASVTVGDNLAGRVFDRYTSRSRRAGSSRTVPSVSLPAGTPLLVFFHDSADLRP